MRKVFSLFLLFPFALGAAAQSEGGMWLGAEADYDITSRLGAELSLGARVEDNFDRLTRYDAGLGFSYKPIRWLKIGVGYDYARDYSPAEGPEIVYKKDKNNAGSYLLDSDGNPIVNGFNSQTDYWRSKNRLTFDLTEKWKVGRFSFSLRERYLCSLNSGVKGVELKYRDEIEDEEDLEGYTPKATPPEGYSSYIPYVKEYYDEDGQLLASENYWYGLDRIGDKKSKAKHAFRTRLGIEYNIRHCPVTPFVSYEISNDLTDGFAVERHRVMGGIDWTFTRDKRHAFEVAYLYQHGAQEETGNADLHILSIGYKFSFESALAKRQKKAAKKARKISK